MPSGVLDILLRYKYFWTSLILTDTLVQIVAINKISPTTGEVEWESETVIKG